MTDAIRWEQRSLTAYTMYDTATGEQAAYLLFFFNEFVTGLYSFRGESAEQELPPELDDYEDPEPAQKYVEALWRMQQ